MNHTFYKIASYFFLSILLLSNVANIHVYSHHQDESLYSDSCQNDSDDNNTDDPCELCLLALNLNNLDYHFFIRFSIEDNIQIAEYNKDSLATYQELGYSQLALNSNRNKAPPYRVLIY